MATVSNGQNETDPGWGSPPRARCTLGPPSPRISLVQMRPRRAGLRFFGHGLVPLPPTGFRAPLDTVAMPSKSTKSTGHGHGARFSRMNPKNARDVTAGNDGHPLLATTPWRWNRRYYELGGVLVAVCPARFACLRELLRLATRATTVVRQGCFRTARGRLEGDPGAGRQRADSGRHETQQGRACAGVSRQATASARRGAGGVVGARGKRQGPDHAAAPGGGDARGRRSDAGRWLPRRRGGGVPLP